MAATQFDAQVRHRDGMVIVDLHGEINAFSEEALNAAYREAEATNPDVVLFNFKDVEYINSTGIALIVSVLARARASRRRLLAYGLSNHYVEIFNITRLVDFMTVVPDEERALADGSASASGSAS